MAHKQAKQRAFELFQKDFYPQDVAATLNVNVRTCQRWFKEFQGDNVASSQPQKSRACSPVSVVFPEEDPKKPKAKHDNDEDLVGEDWYTFASKLASNHFYVHNKVREKIERILNQTLEEPDLNLRALHTLSIALTRHIDAERTAASLDFLNINVAAKRLNVDGYLVVESDEFHEKS